MSDTFIAIIGGGNMGGAFYKSLSAVYGDESVFVCDKNIEKLQQLGVKNYSSDVNEVVSKAQVVIVAVKPQSFDALCGELTVSLSEKLVISIMAGISLETIVRKIKCSRAVRSMPNLPVQIGEGVVGWFATRSVNQNDKRVVEKVFSSMGTQLELSSEDMIDAITALSGSGPAYYFYFCEMMAKKAEALGFDQKQSQLISEKTFIGAAKLLEKNTLTAQQWREAVTSKGGTTRAALNSFDENSLGNLFMDGIDSAYRRAQELQKLME